MAASTVVSGYGVEIYTDIATPSTFAKLGLEVQNVNGPPLSVDAADATHAESDNGFEEMLPTIIRTGNLTAQINFLPGATDIGLLYSTAVAKTKFSLQLRFPPPLSGMRKMFTVRVFINGIEPATPHDGKMSANVSFRITGPITGPADVPS